MTLHLFFTIGFFAVYHQNFGHGHFLMSLVEFYQAKLSCKCIVIGLDRRSGGAEQGFCTVH